MSFLAIVHAPVLRAGARLCISDRKQSCGQGPAGLAPGSEIALRFGTCCPDLARGTILACDAELDEAVLRVADTNWTIRRSAEGGVAIPGLVAEDWIVAAG